MVKFEIKTEQKNSILMLLVKKFGRYVWNALPAAQRHLVARQANGRTTFHIHTSLPAFSPFPCRVMGWKLGPRFAADHRRHFQVVEKEAGFRRRGIPILRDVRSTGIESGKYINTYRPIFWGFLSNS